MRLNKETATLFNNIYFHLTPTERNWVKGKNSKSPWNDCITLRLARKKNYEENLPGDIAWDFFSLFLFAFLFFQFLGFLWDVDGLGEKQMNPLSGRERRMEWKRRGQRNLWVIIMQNDISRSVKESWSGTSANYSLFLAYFSVNDRIRRAKLQII